MHCCETRRTFPDERFPLGRRRGVPSGERRRLRTVRGAVSAGGYRRRDRTVTMRQGSTKHRTRRVAMCAICDRNAPTGRSRKAGAGPNAGSRLRVRRPRWRASARRRSRRPASVAATSSTTPRWRGSDMCPTPRKSTLRAPQVGVVAPARGGRQHHLVEVAVDGGDPGAASRRRLGELLQHRGARAQLADQRGGKDVRPHRALVRRPEGHEGLDPVVATLALDVVAGDQPAEAVADDVHAVVPGLLADALDVRAEVGGTARDVGQQRAVVPAAHVGEPPAPQAAVHHREDRPVVHEAVDQEDRGPRGQGIVGEQGPDGRRLDSRPVAGVGPECRAPRAERVHQHVGADPGQFGEPAGQRGRATETAQAPSWRFLGRGRRVPLWTTARVARWAHCRIPPRLTNRRRQRVRRRGVVHG